nr:hypothetical protein [Pseudomonadota bacterium]
MATGYIEYITSEGDRWDTIAWRYYGDPLAYEGIILANPNTVHLTKVFMPFCREVRQEGYLW